MKPRRLLPSGWPTNTLVVLVFCALAAACTPAEKKLPPLAFAGEAQGTYYSFIYFDSLFVDYQKEVDSIFKIVDRTLSLWEPNSLINRINANEETAVDSLFLDVFEKSKQLSIWTNGAFDMTVGPLTRALGFGSAAKQKLSSREIDSLKQYVNYQKINIENGRIIKEIPNVSIDFNAIAKGYTVDLLGAFLESKGIVNYLIDVGGEIRCRGSKTGGMPWVIGVEKPAEHKYAKQEVDSKTTLLNRSIATSGNYRKYVETEGGRYGHTIDPKTGMPVVNRMLSASVIANETWKADGFATAMMVMGLEKAQQLCKQHQELECFVIYTDSNANMQYWFTPNFF